LQRPARALSRGAGCRRPEARHLPHPRYRRRQGVALHGDGDRGESGARLARDPARARPAGSLARPDSRAAPRRRRTGAAHHVPDDLRCRRIRRGKSHCRARADIFAPARPRAAGAHRRRHHGGSPGTALSDGRAAQARRLRLGRLQRPVPVPVCGRPRQRQGIGAFRHAVGGDPARAARDRAQGQCREESRLALRRDGIQANRRAGADRAGLSLAVAIGDRARPGEGDDPRPRRQEGRGDDQSAPGRAGRNHLGPAEADRIRGSRGAGVVAGLSDLAPAPIFLPFEIFPMSMLPEAKLDVLLAHHASLEAQILGQLSSDKYVQITREFAELNPLIDAVKAYRSTVKELTDTEALIADPATDADMRGMAEAELETLQARRGELEQKIRLALLPKDAMDDRNVVLEIRAGTGGDEASLFAGDLFRMYERFANLLGWKVEVISASEGTVGGYKEIIAEVQGRGAFSKLKFESGVHRVQRVPDTETQGRIHTSAATVAVLPEVEDVDVDIKNDDLRIETMRAQGAGGQHVNKT